MREKIVYVIIGLFYLLNGRVIGQFSRPVSVGFGAGSIYGLTDLANEGMNFAFYGELDYVIDPFISIGLHAEKGKLNADSDGNHIENRYYVGNINGKLRLGKFMRRSVNYAYDMLMRSTLSNIFSNIYIGGGIGLMKNSITGQLTADYQKGITAGGGELIREPSGVYLIAPLNIGVDIPFGRTFYGPQWAVNVNYQHTWTMDDNLDGIVNNNNDQYGYISVGLKYALFSRK